MAAVYVVAMERKMEYIISIISGALFGIGLILSGMCRISKVVGFLTALPDVWDPSLAFVMASAVGINLITFHFILQRSSPMFMPYFSVPNNNKIDAKLLGGEALFGVGWGLAGLCPGPGMINLLVLTPVLIWIASLAAGQILADFFLKKTADPLEQPLIK